MINLDKLSFNRFVKNQYSWLQKDDVLILNNKVKEKTTFILESWCTSEWFSMEKVGTFDSLKF